MNTPSQGQFRWMVFKDAKKWIGTALEFKITIVGDDPRVVESELQEAVLGYLESAKKLSKRFRPTQVNSVLNQKPAKEDEARWATAHKSLRGGVLPPLSSEIYKFGVANLAVA